MTKRNRTLLGVLVVSIGAAGLAADRLRIDPVADSRTSAPPNPLLAVTTVAAERVAGYSRRRHYTGLLREVRRSQLSFQRGGELIELLVDEGDPVAQGQVLGHLDARHIFAAQARLHAQVNEAKAVLAELLAGPRKESIAAKRAELQALQAQQQVLAGQLARRKQLVQSMSVSREEYETFLFDYQAAKARADAVERQLEELVAGTRKEQISAQRARLAQLDAELTDVAHDLQDTALRAPFAGSISRRKLDEGTVVSPGTPVLEIIDSQIEAWVGVPQSAALALRVGGDYELEVAGRPVHSTLRSLGPDMDQPTRTRSAILRLHPGQTGIVPGQVARLAVSERVAEAGYWVPTTALSRGVRGLWSVYVVAGEADESSVERSDVELLDTTGERSFVRGALQPGDRIVASGTHRVVVGQRVVVVEQPLAQKSM